VSVERESKGVCVVNSACVGRWVGGIGKEVDVIKLHVVGSPQST
jgi:hypothetical protein